MPQGQKTEPTSILFDNQVIAVEVEANFSRESIANTRNGTRNGHVSRSARTFIAEGLRQTRDKARHAARRW